MLRHCVRCSALSAVWGLLLSAPASAGTLPDSFTLGQYIPGDVWMYIHSVRNPERDWLDAEWEEVCDAFRDSGVVDDAVHLMTSLLGEKDRAKAEKLLDLIWSVKWRDLVGHSRELAFAERLGKGLPPYEYLVLIRTGPGVAEANIKSLVAIIEQIASWTNELQVSRRTPSGVTVWSLRVTRQRPGQPAPNVDLFRKGDVIGLSFGSSAAYDIIRLMTGKADTPPIVARPRFQAALREVKAPEDSVMFFDVKLLFGGIDQLLTTGVGQTKVYHGAEKIEVTSTIRKLLLRFNIFDYTIITEETDGRRVLTHTMARLGSPPEGSPFANALFNRRPFDRFDEFIPADATGFSVNAMVDLEQLYKLTIDIVENDIPNGAKYVSWWNEKLTSIGFDPQRDVFNWWSGEAVSVTLPPAPTSPMGNPEWVLVFRVKDGELATRKVNSALRFLCSMLKMGGQPVIVSPAPVKADGFLQITHPMFAMLMRPVIGVKDRWLMVGSSPVAINKCLDVAAGEAPSIRTSERFKQEGLIPTGPVSSVSFKDLSNSGEESRMIVGLAATLVGGYAAAIPDRPDTRGIKTVLHGLPPILMKLGPVLEKMDFHSSQAGLATYDGQLTVRSEAVTTYKPAPPSGTRKTKME